MYVIAFGFNFSNCFSSSINLIFVKDFLLFDLYSEQIQKLILVVSIDFYNDHVRMVLESIVKIL